MGSMITVEFVESKGWTATRGGEGSREHLHRDGTWRSSVQREDGACTGYFYSQMGIVTAAAAFGQEIKVLKRP